MDKSKNAAALFNKHANEYQAKFMDVNLYTETFDIFCSHIAQRNAKIFEIACGPGNITRYLLNKRPDFNILGIDLSENMIRLAKINNPQAEFKLMDCRDIDKIDGRYDGIMCGFCLPYLSKEESVKLIADASALLKPGGLLYLSTMEDDYSKSGFKKSSTGEEIFMHYHQADYLTGALSANFFKIIDCRRIEYPGPDGINIIDLIIVSEKNK